MATDVSGVTGLARRYATALFELAAEQDNLDQVAADLAALVVLLGESNDLQRLVRSPVLSRGEQMQAMAAILESAGAAPTNFPSNEVFDAHIFGPTKFAKAKKRR